MPRDLADVLHYFLPELDEPEAKPGAPDRRGATQTALSDPGGAKPAAGASELPILGLPIGERDVVRAALAWNLAVETSRLGATTLLVAPESDRGSPLWPAPGRGPLGSEMRFCAAEDVASLASCARRFSRECSARARKGGIVFVRVPPAWLARLDARAQSLRDGIDWWLLLSSSGPRDLEQTLEQTRSLHDRFEDAEIGITIHGVARIAEARGAFESLNRRAEQQLGRPLTSYGLLVDDLSVYRAIASQRPIGLAHPQAPATRALGDVARLLYEDARSRALG